MNGWTGYFLLGSFLIKALLKSIKLSVIPLLEVAGIYTNSTLKYANFVKKPVEGKWVYAENKIIYYTQLFYFLSKEVDL